MSNITTEISSTKCSAFVSVVSLVFWKTKHARLYKLLSEAYYCLTLVRHLVYSLNIECCLSIENVGSYTSPIPRFELFNIFFDSDSFATTTNLFIDDTHYIRFQHVVYTSDCKELVLHSW